MPVPFHKKTLCLFPEKEFSMFSFSSHYVKMPRRFAARITVVLFCLFLLFTGCSTGGDNELNHAFNEALIGTWGAGNSEAYDITKEHITYNGYGGSIAYAGTIEYVTNFSDDSGVLIIKYDADHKATYYEDGHFNDPNYILPPKGDYLGIYFKTLKPGVSVAMGGAFIAGGAEEATLGAAITAFTIGNEGKYMTYYGTYEK